MIVWLMYVITLTAVATRLFRYVSQKMQIQKIIDRIPGPKKYPILGSGMEFIKTPRTEKLKLTLKYHEEFGPIYRIWYGPSRASVHVATPECAEALLTSRKNINKAFGYDLYEPWLGTGLLTSSGSKWHSRRKMLTPAFHFSILDTFHDIFVENGKILVDKLQAELVSDDGFNVLPYIKNCTLDVICETAMGVKINAQSHSSEYVQSVEKINEAIYSRLYNPLLWMDNIYSFSETYKKQCSALKVLHGMSLNVIKLRQQQRKNRNSEDNTSISDLGTKPKKMFLDLLLDIAEQSEGHLTDADIREEVDTFMFEGHDTISTAIAWTLFLIGSHPEIQEKITEELAAVFDLSDRPASMNDMTELKYLEIVIKESLRLFPSVPFIARTLTEDVKMVDYLVPAGTTVRLNIYQLHRQPNQFPNPEEFNPENFSSDNALKRHPFAYIPFSAGPRNCIGQKFAMLELKILLSTLLRMYHVTSLQKLSEMDIVAESVLNPPGGIRLKIKRRM